MIEIEQPTLSVAETASLLGISRWLVQQAVHDGSLPSVRDARRSLIPRRRLLAWLDGMDGPVSGVCAPAGNTSEPPFPCLPSGSGQFAQSSINRKRSGSSGGRGLS
ncbi:MAG: excisionase family DNA-binding protein [Acidimicrobiales bacterium]